MYGVKSRSILGKGFQFLQQRPKRGKLHLPFSSFQSGFKRVHFLHQQCLRLKPQQLPLIFREIRPPFPRDQFLHGIHDVAKLRFIAAVAFQNGIGKIFQMGFIQLRQELHETVLEQRKFSAQVAVGFGKPEVREDFAAELFELDIAMVLKQIFQGLFVHGIYSP